MRKLLFMLFLLVLLPVHSYSAILFYDDAEDTFSTTDWYWPAHNTTYGRTITSSSEQARSGSKSYKFVLPEPYIASVNNSHVELLLNALNSPTKIQNFPRNKEFWIGYSIYIPADFKTPYNPSNHGATMQFHSAGDACDNSVSNGPTCTFFYRPELGRWRFYVQGVTAECTGYTKDRAKSYYFDYTPGKWHDVVLNFKFDWRAYNNPFFKVWVNGEQVVNDQGINCWNDTKGPRFHIGIYAQPFEQDMVVFFDEIKIGDANSSYNEVAPSGTPPVVLPDPIEITTSDLGDFVQNETYSGTLAATGGTTPYTWSSADKPAWLTLNTNGSWSAAPTASGSYNFSVTVTDDESATDTKSFSGSITSAAVVYPEVESFSLPYRNNSLTVPITNFTGDETATHYITVVGSSVPPGPSGPGWAETAPTEVVAPAEGQYEVWAYVKNADGVVSQGVVGMILVDLSYTPPSELTIRAAPKILKIKGYRTSYFVRPSGGDYGTEDGTSYENAWDGIGHIDWSKLGPGTTLYLCGTHTGAYFEIQTHGNSVSDFVIDGGYPGDPGVLDANYTQSHAIRCSGRLYVTIKNITLKNGSDTGLFVFGSRNIVAENITVDGSGGIGINAESENLVLKNSSVTNSHTSGVRVYNSPNALIDGVSVVGCGQPGTNADNFFIGDGSTNFVISNCTAKNNNSDGTGFDVSGDSANLTSGVIRNCWAENMVGGGAYSAGVGTEKEQVVRFEYCVAWECKGPAFAAKESVTAEFYNCVAYSTQECNYIPINMSGWDDVHNRNIVIKNCIFMTNSTSPMFAVRSGDTVIASNNCWYNFNPAPAFMQYLSGGGNTTKTWAEWQAAGLDANSFNNVDPAFTDPSSGDFTLTSGSLALDSGIDVGLSADFIGNSVPKGSGVDMGAYERN